MFAALEAIPEWLHKDPERQTSVQNCRPLRQFDITFEWLLGHQEVLKKQLSMTASLDEDVSSCVLVWATSVSRIMDFMAGPA